MGFSFFMGIENEKGEQECPPFCPKSTMNLTYLCYGMTQIYIVLKESIKNIGSNT